MRSSMSWRAQPIIYIVGWKGASCWRAGSPPATHLSFSRSFMTGTDPLGLMSKSLHGKKTVLHQIILLHSCRVLSLSSPNMAFPRDGMYYTVVPLSAQQA